MLLLYMPCQESILLPIVTTITCGATFSLYCIYTFSDHLSVGQYGTAA
jgi:hypothetical protein